MSALKGATSGSMSSISGMTSSLGKLGIAVAAVAIAIKALKALVQNALNVADTGDAIKDNAQKVFMSTAAYQEWGYVLKQNGLEMANLKVGMRQFAQHVANGDDVLQKYGITAKNVDEAFEQAIHNIQNLNTETEKIAAATELFGTRALDLMPVLNMTNAETESLMYTYRLLGGTMSDELVAASDVCNDSITELKASWQGLKNILAQWVLPTITNIVQWLTIAIAKVRIVLAAFFGLKETFGSSSKKNSVAGASASTAQSTGGTAKNLGKAAKKAKELKRTLMGIDELSKLAEQATASAGGGGGGISVGGGLGDLGDMESLVDGFLDSETMQKLSEFQEKVEGIADKLHGLYLIVKGVGEVFLTWDKNKGIGDILEGLALIFPKMKVVSELWESIQTKKAELKLTLADSFSGAWAAVKKKWEEVKTKTATVSLNLRAAVAGPYNSAAKKINGWIGKLPKAVRPKWRLPYLARGGILTDPTMAIMGEYAGAKQNPEIATPQSLMYETVQKANGDLVSAFATMTRQVIAAIENKDLDVRIGDEQIARSAQRGNTAYYNRTGKALLTI